MGRQLMFLILLFVAANAKAQESLPFVSSGTLQRITAFPSTHVKARNVDVWLPAGYSSAKKHSVLYMHDGQMLFDAATTWNKQAWEVDKVAGKLNEEVVQGWRDSIPLKRGGTPEDVANACLFLASDLCAYVTGQVMNVDGGMLT